MTNKLFRLLALCAALVLALSAGLSALAEEAADDPVLFTFDGAEVRKSEVQQTLDNLLAAGYVSDASDYELAIEYTIQNRVLDGKIKELGLDQFTAEEEEALRSEANATWEDAIASYISYFLTDDTDEAREKARQEGIEYFNAYGYSEEALYDSMKTSAAYDRLEQHILEGRDTAVTAEEIRADFEAQAAQQQASVQDNIYMYELYQNYYGMNFWYVPEGYRGIIHILMKVDEDLLSAYQSAQAAFEESVTDEAPEGSAELKAARDAALDAVLASKKAEIDDIYARLANGEDFASLIAQYGEDSGMTDASYLAKGYAVHKDSVIYDPVFTSGAFSEKMQQPGDTSDPVVGSYGIHILHYLRDIPSGIVELTDEISAEIEEALYTEKVNSIYAEVIDGWKKEHEVVKNQEAIDALNAAAETTEAE